MSRADELRARLEAELRVLELEERLTEAKEAGGDYTDLKHELRQARREFRAERAGDANADPAVIETAAAMPTLGGGE